MNIRQILNNNMEKYFDVFFKKKIVHFNFFYLKEN